MPSRARYDQSGPRWFFEESLRIDISSQSLNSLRPGTRAASANSAYVVFRAADSVASSNSTRFYQLEELCASSIIGKLPSKRCR